MPFLVVLIFWLAIISASLGLVADNEATLLSPCAFLRFRLRLRFSSSFS